MGTTLFGHDDKHPILTESDEAYCIAKLERLVGPLGPLPKIMKPEHAREFEAAESLRHRELGAPWIGQAITVRPWREELERLENPAVPKELLDFLEYLLTVDYKKRPDVSDALGHPYLNCPLKSEVSVEEGGFSDCLTRPGIQPQHRQ